MLLDLYRPGPNLALLAGSDRPRLWYRARERPVTSQGTVSTSGLPQVHGAEKGVEAPRLRWCFSDLEATKTSHDSAYVVSSPDAPTTSRPRENLPRGAPLHDLHTNPKSSIRPNAFFRHASSGESTRGAGFPC